MSDSEVSTRRRGHGAGGSSMGRHHARPRVGTAGWQVPARWRDRFDEPGSHLQRYASRLSAVEINSCFYRPHAARVYERWARAVPDDFLFAVKCPKTITHEQRLGDVKEPLARFLDEVRGLGPKLGPLLVQLPPSHAFDARVVGRFLDTLCASHQGPVVVEPRHASWLADVADVLLRDFGVARVAADPAMAPGFEQPGGSRRFRYFRWHGSPRMYWSDYEDERLVSHAARISAEDVEAWTIFDNTADGAAAGNALSLVSLLRPAARAAGDT